MEEYNNYLIAHEQRLADDPLLTLWKGLATTALVLLTVWSATQR